MQNQVYQQEGQGRLVRVLWTYPCPVKELVAVCQVLSGGSRVQTKIQAKRLQSPVLWTRRPDLEEAVHGEV